MFFASAYFGKVVVKELVKVNVIGSSNMKHFFYSLLIFCCSAFANASPFRISGVVFEDVNYGGGEGRSYAVADASAVASGFGLGEIAVASARVELYDAAGSFLSSTLTDPSGRYEFSVLSGGNYTVRVVNSSVLSNRSGATSSLRGVQTFRTDASSGVAVPDLNRVGGENPSRIDSGNGATTLAALESATATAQSLSPVLVIADDVPAVDFGFNFNTIVNVANTGQGSLRQFIANANALTVANLAIEAQPVGKDVSIFMISSGSAVPGLRAGLPNQLIAGVAVIEITTALPAISADNVTLDGTTQTVNVGDTNTGSEGFSGAVGYGAGAGTIDQVPRPEVEVRRNVSSGTSFVFNVTGVNNTIRGLAIRKSDGAAATIDAIRHQANANNALVELNFIGSSATGFSDPGLDNRIRYGINCISSVNGIIRDNLIGHSTFFGVFAQSSTNVLIEQNTLLNNGMVSPDANPNESIRIFGEGGTVVLHNYIGETARGNIELGQSANVTIHGNTIENGMQTAISGVVPAQNAAIVAMAAENVTISNNIIRDTRNGHGVLVNSRNGINGSAVHITENSIYRNALLGINVNISDVAVDDTNDAVTPNDGLKNASTANFGMDYPIASSAYLNAAGDELTLSGYVGSNPAGNPVFANSEIEVFLADEAGLISGEVVLGDNLSVPHGQGRVFLGRLLADSNGLFSGTLSVSGLSIGDILTMTATDEEQNTSEFSNNIILTEDPMPVVLVSFTARASEGVTLLNWATSAEINSARFEVQHSTDAAAFQAIGLVTASGESSGIRRYHFSHPAPLAGINYYRLKMIDRDGTFAYSAVVSVRVSGGFELLAYPNPATSQLKLKREGTLRIRSAKLVSALGVVLAMADSTESTSTELSLPVGDVPAGFYVISVVYENGVQESKKIVIGK